MDKLSGMIIEDDGNHALIYSTALSAAGYECEIIYNGAAARKRLTEVIPHLIVLDMHLPEVSGLELLRQIQADSRLRHTHIIVGTVDAQMAGMARESRGRNVWVMEKPISYEQLRDLAARLKTARTETGPLVSKS